MYSVVKPSIWEWGIIQALDPDLSASTADDNSDDRISIDEIEDFAYDFTIEYLLDYEEYSQDPQRQVGTLITSPSFLGDGYY